MGKICITGDNMDKIKDHHFEHYTTFTEQGRVKVRSTMRVSCENWADMRTMPPTDFALEEALREANIREVNGMVYGDLRTELLQAVAEYKNTSMMRNPFSPSGTLITKLMEIIEALSR